MKLLLRYKTVYSNISSNAAGEYVPTFKSPEDFLSEKEEVVHRNHYWKLLFLKLTKIWFKLFDERQFNWTLPGGLRHKLKF